MEVAVVIIAAAVAGLLVIKSVNRDDSLAPLQWPAAPATPRHELALARQPNGVWAPGGTASADSTLTVTLVVPWDEVGERYSGLNVVVR